MLKQARSKVAFLLAGCVCAGGLLGCNGGDRVWDVQALRDEPFTVNSPSLVLGRPLEYQAGQGAEAASLADGGAWWVSRNDSRLGVREEAAYRPAGVFRVDVYDRQSSRNGVIRDSYRRSFRGEEIGRIYR